MTYQVILQPVAQVFIIVLIGVLLRKCKVIGTDLDRALTQVIVKLLFPCLIFSKIVDNPALDDRSNLIWAPILGFVFVAGGYLLCYVIAPFVGIRDPKSRGAFCVTTGNFNYGFIPIPLAISLFDDRTVGTLFLHNVGVEIALWSVGIALLTGHFNRSSFRHLFNPPLCTILVGVAIHLAGWSAHVPAIAMNTSETLGQCAIPISLLLIGMTIGTCLEGRPQWASLRIAVPACVLRLALIPLAMLGCALILPITTDLKRVIVLQVAMPSAVFPILLARHYHSDPQTALRIVLSTSLLAMVTLPLWLTFGLDLIGN